MPLLLLLYRLPGIFFFYEVSPLHVEISEEYQAGWVAFLTSVCAVVGGVVTLVGMLDQYMFSRGHRQRELLI
jgi:endoplasmic reticulum-Golgi intermediate compartment protein 3